MKLLIVGASSFIGRNLLEELVEGSYPFSKVTATFFHDSSFPAFAESLSIEAIQCDARDSNCRWDRYDTCVYLAGNSDHGLAIRDPKLDLSMNAELVLNFLKTFHGHLVYMSSGAVYYGLKGYVDVRARPNPVFSYGISKLACEHYIKAFHHSHCLGSYMIFRLFYAYGRYDKPRRLIPQVVKALLLDGRNEFSVGGTGQSFMDPLNARYVAQVLAMAASRYHINDVFDLCGGHNQTVIDVVKDIAQVLGKDITVSADGTAEMFPVEFYSSSDRIMRVLDISDLPSFEEGVKAYARWIVEQRGGK